jgi:hypothetical protein
MPGYQGSVGYTNLYGSVGPTPMFSLFSLGKIDGSLGTNYVQQSTLGGGLPGFIPQQLQLSDDTSEYPQNRFILKEAWNTNYLRAKIPSTVTPGQPSSGVPARGVTPFRAVTNSGDVLSRQNFSCGGTCQTFQSRPGLHGLKIRFGHIGKNCYTSDAYPPEPAIPAAACNVRYVYDSSDYSRYLKERAINKNYNNKSNGGNDYNASQSAWRAIRRY